ncbi:MAG: SCO family protein [Planctomycetota bacterium]|nr:SCO family protein [Planctomycetota bacterium]
MKLAWMGALAIGLGMLIVVWLKIGSSQEDGLLDFDDISIGGDFTLIAQDGQPYTLSEHQGEVRLLFFGFTHCPDICPTTLLELNKVYAQLGGAGEEVTTLFVSVDPERDTPELLGDYLGSFDIPVVGLTCSVEEVEQVVSAYAGWFEKVALDSAAVYTMDHSTRSYLIDREGKVRYIFSYDDGPERIAHIVRKLLP